MAKKGNTAQPAAPDPVATANAQAAANSRAAQEQVKLNTYDQFGPSGSVTYTRDANGLPIAQNVNLSGTGAQIFERQQNMQLGLMDRANDALGYVSNGAFTTDGMPYDPRSVDTSQMGELNLDGRIYAPNTYGNMTDYSGKVGDAIMQSQLDKMNPVFDQRRAQVANDLEQRGIPIGSEAYGRAMGNLEREQNQAVTNAANMATIGQGAEASRIFGMEQTLGDKDWQQRFQANDALDKDFANKYNLEQTIRGNAIQDELLGRTQNFNEAQAFFGGTGQLAQPNAVNRAQASIASPDVAGLTTANYNAQLNAANQAQQRQDALWGGVGQLAGTAMMWSSKTMKRRLGGASEFLDRLDLVDIHTWKYDAGTGLDQDVHIGPYAEDWNEAFGLAAGKQINVIDAFGVALQCIKELRLEQLKLQKRLDKLSGAHHEQLELL